MNLVIDFGNSFVKIAVLDKDKIVWKNISENFDIEIVSDVFLRLQHIQYAIVSSVSDKHVQIVDFLASRTDFYINLNGKTILPFENLYKTPDSLGNDRLAAVAGALLFFPDKNCFVIDAGTAITFDFLNENKQYLGGNISPGLNMRFRALHTFTKKLPLLAKDKTVPFLGYSTESAIIAGVQNGIAFEIDGYISAMQNKFKELNVILSGGDAIFFENKLKNNIFVVPDLIILGLNFILNYNIKISGRKIRDEN